MTIAPLAVLGIANAAFSLIGSLADAVSRPDPRPSQSTQQAFPQAQESVWHQLGKGVDVRALTRDELAVVSQQLYRSGAIGLHDHAALSLDPSFAGSAELLTSPDGNGRVDWVAEFQARLARHLEQGDEDSAAQDRRVLDILGRLQAGGKGVTSLRV
jgi:hypothetical protein